MILHFFPLHRGQKIISLWAMCGEKPAEKPACFSSLFVFLLVFVIIMYFSPIERILTFDKDLEIFDG